MSAEMLSGQKTTNPRQGIETCFHSVEVFRNLRDPVRKQRIPARGLKLYPVSITPEPNRKLSRQKTTNPRQGIETGFRGHL